MEAEYLLSHLENPRPHSCDLLDPYNSRRKNALPRANVNQLGHRRRPLPQSSSLVKLTPRLRGHPADPFNRSNNHDDSHPFEKAMLSRIGGSFVQNRICPRWAVACRHGGRLTAYHRPGLHGYKQNHTMQTASSRNENVQRINRTTRCGNGNGAVRRVRGYPCLVYCLSPPPSSWCPLPSPLRSLFCNVCGCVLSCPIYVPLG